MKLKQWLVVVALNGALGASVKGAVNLSLHPSTVADDARNVTLTINGLNAGETVLVQKYLDANQDGVADAGDWLVGQFPLTDGQASVVAGVTNSNVPGDTDSTVGTITAQLNLQAGGIEQRFAGQFLFKVSSPADRFAPLSEVLTVTNAETAQAFSGRVQANGTNVPNAAVLLFNGTVGGSSFSAAAVADAAANYTVRAAPGTYNLVPLKPGFVADLGAAPMVTLGAGATIVTNLELLAGSQGISGQFVEAASPANGLGGMLVVCQSSDDMLAIGFTDTNGNFSIPVTASQWRVGWEDAALSLLGYVNLLNQSTVDTMAGDVTGLTVSFPKATALIYGNLKDEQNDPLAGITFFADDSSNSYEGSGTTDANGNYVAAVSAGTWYTSPDRSSAALANHIVSQGSNLTLSVGQAVVQNFTAHLAPNHISGLLLDLSNNPVANVGIYGYATINETTYNQYADTAADGSYSFSVTSGSWTLGVNCSGGNDSLRALKYQCVNNVSINIAGADVATNFIVQPCGQPVATTTSPLVPGRVGFYYEVLLQAAGCNQPFTWSLAPGSQPLPAGLGLGSDGTLAGYPTASGTFSFIVRVTDSNANHADQGFALAIESPPLQVVTSALPNGTTGASYSQELSASGGQPPYSWSVSPVSGNLPPDLSLSQSGLLSGIPTLAATFYFDVTVTDALGTNAEQSFSLVIFDATPRLVAPEWSPNGQFQFQLQAAAGQTYTVEFSSDLKTWATVQTTNAPSVPFTVTVPGATGNRGFYRVRVGM